MSMFCPKCGKSDQLPETYCRQCGVLLPDLDKPARRRDDPDQQFKSNAVLAAFSIVVCFTLAILLYVILGFRDQHPLIYITAAMLIAMGAWQIPSLIATLRLRKKFRGTRAAAASTPEQTQLEAVPTARPLSPASLDDLVPPSVIEQTTKQLDNKVPR